MATNTHAPEIASGSSERPYGISLETWGEQNDGCFESDHFWRSKISVIVHIVVVVALVVAATTFQTTQLLAHNHTTPGPPPVHSRRLLLSPVWSLLARLLDTHTHATGHENFQHSLAQLGNGTYFDSCPVCIPSQLHLVTNSCHKITPLYCATTCGHKWQLFWLESTDTPHNSLTYCKLNPVCTLLPKHFALA